MEILPLPPVPLPPPMAVIGETPIATIVSRRVEVLSERVLKRREGHGGRGEWTLPGKKPTLSWKEHRRMEKTLLPSRAWRFR